MRGDAEGRLYLQALTAYSDGCTIPLLTPECPYYRNTESGATCEEECRTILTGAGVDRAPKSYEVIPGLTMHGTALPTRVASGLSLFDVTEIQLQDLGQRVCDQQTSTLLLRMRELVVVPPKLRDDPDDSFIDVVEELRRRGIPTGAILGDVTSVMVADSLLRAAEATADLGLEGWHACIGAVPPEARFEKLHAWLAHCAETNLNAFHQWQPPPAHVFAATSTLPPRDDVIWLWERFTEADLQNWRPASLILEWRWAELRDPAGYDARLLRARELTPSELAVALIQRLADAPPPRTGATPAQRFTASAGKLLSEGDAEAAADIFVALVHQSPNDGEMLNNLGFCLIPDNRVQALKVLERAAWMPGVKSGVNIANRAFVLHLLSKDSEALSVLQDLESDGDTAYLWVEQECGRFQLALMRVDEYASNLIEHIRSNLRLSPDEGAASAEG